MRRRTMLHVVGYVWGLFGIAHAALGYSVSVDGREDGIEKSPWELVDVFQQDICDEGCAYSLPNVKRGLVLENDGKNVLAWQDIEVYGVSSQQFVKIVLEEIDGGIVTAVMRFPEGQELQDARDTYGSDGFNHAPSFDKIDFRWRLEPTGKAFEDSAAIYDLRVEHSLRWLPDWLLRQQLRLTVAGVLDTFRTP